MSKKIVVFTGAGMSADSGLSTFRDADGLWDRYRIEDVCTPEALAKNRQLVIDFYNIRRKELLSKEPNAGHLAIRRLEDYFEVEVITQNIDDLHERAGSSRITHLHGELRKLRSSIDETLTVPIEGWETGVRYPLQGRARCCGRSWSSSGRAYRCSTGRRKSPRLPDIFVIVGTSLAVYPAASLVR